MNIKLKVYFMKNLIIATIVCFGPIAPATQAQPSPAAQTQLFATQPYGFPNNYRFKLKLKSVYASKSTISGGSKPLKGIPKGFPQFGRISSTSSFRTGKKMGELILVGKGIKIDFGAVSGSVHYFSYDSSADGLTTITTTANIEKNSNGKATSGIIYIAKFVNSSSTTTAVKYEFR